MNGEARENNGSKRPFGEERSDCDAFFMSFISATKCMPSSSHFTLYQINGSIMTLFTSKRGEYMNLIV